ncbi:MAG: hypothetical protein NTZ16_06590 [Verrucomicrobia bacterium]|nr:hypothetical protein [Verrucomicrobiota bacterium]
MKNSIKLLPVTILTLGFCALGITGCGKASAPKNEVTLAELNRVVSMMSTSLVGAPRTVEELTNVPAFKGRPFPTPPAGKKFAIDPVTHQIVVVDR